MLGGMSKVQNGVSMSEQKQSIDYHRAKDGVGQIVVNQPARRNALTADMWETLPERLAEARDDRDLKVLIITGAEAHFCAGADISEFEALYGSAESSAETSAMISKGLDAVANFPRPTLAKIRGACVGGGAAIALACDIRIAASNAIFAVTPAKMGLVYPFNDIVRLVDAVGQAAAKDMLFSSRKMKAQDAKSMGLVHTVHEEFELNTAVANYAKEVSANSPHAVKTMKRMLSVIAKGQYEDTVQTKQMFSNAFIHHDFKEGYRAFLEKRKPKF